MSDEPNHPALTIAEIRLAKEAAQAKIAQAIHEATIDFAHETGIAITSINVYMPEVTRLGDERSSFVLGGVEVEVEKI